MKGALLLVTAAAMAVGCADNDLSLSITRIGIATQAGECAVDPAGATVGLVRGTLDLARAQQLNTGYIASPIVRNNLPSRLQAAGVEYNSIQVIGLNVELQTVDGAQIRKPYFVAAAGGRIDPGGSASVPAEIIPYSTAAGLSGQTVIAVLRAIGMRANDQLVGGAFNFPIDICAACLGGVPPACPLPATPMPRSAGCLPQQDDPGDCCTASTGQILCGNRAPIATM